MRLLVLGIDHHRADVALRERLAIPDASAPAVLATVRERFAECALLSTCNRTELYLLVGHERSGRRAGLEFLASQSGISVDELYTILFEHWQERAVSHLFRVACGLESLIVGEHQILGQVRDAGERARAAGCTGPGMTRLFHDAVSVGKRARSESGIARSAVSISAAAVDLGRQTLGSLEGTSALVIGAGKMGSLAARGLADRGVKNLVIASRTRSRAQSLAARVKGRAISYAELSDAVASSDVVISATAADEYVLDEATVGVAVNGRLGRPLVLVDIAVPRDIDPAVGELPACTLFNVDDLNAVKDAGLAARRQEIGKVESMIERAVGRFMAWWHARDVTPTITEIVAQAEAIRSAEVERVVGRLDSLSARDRNVIDALTQAIVNKMLHGPIVRLKERGAQHDSRVYVHAVRELFGLPQQAASDSLSRGRAARNSISDIQQEG